MIRCGDTPRRVTFVLLSCCALLFFSTFTNALNDTAALFRIAPTDESQDHEFYLANYQANTVRLVPDKVTLKLICTNVSAAPTVSKRFLDSFERIDPLPSLEKDAENADETMRQIVRTAKVMRPPTFVVGNEIKIPFTALNPCIELYNDILFVSYREGIWEYPIKMFWLPFTEAEMGNFKNLRNIDIQLKPSGFDKWGKEDPRIMMRPNGKLLMQYTAKNTWNTAIRQHFTEFTIHNHTLPNGKMEITLEPSEPCVLDDKITPLETKNWIALHTDEGRINLIEEINPRHLLAYGENCSYVNSTITPRLHPHHHQLHVPWRGHVYGSFLKGGTPALMVNGHYLAFFHTDESHTATMTTYYMGAITFCPQFPYRIHSISEYAIMLDQWYEGEWSHTSRDYVVFPMGFIKHPDGKHLLLSYGRQDKDGYIIKINIVELLASLRKMASCAPFG